MVIFSLKFVGEFCKTFENAISVKDRSSIYAVMPMIVLRQRKLSYIYDWLPPMDWSRRCYIEYTNDNDRKEKNKW
jgi:hypothetical protein